MRTLIDGYNLMHARGLLNGKLGPERFRKARQRFLNDLAAAIEPVEAHETTVVFDAAAPPSGFPRESRHKGMTILFAVDDEDADARIEWLIAHHPTPRTLTVVSSDNRVRQAANRRKARSVSAEDFLTHLDAKSRRKPEIPPQPALPKRERVLSAEESAYWSEAFRDLDEAPETREALSDGPSILTDAEIAEIQREVDRDPDPAGHRPRPFRGRPKG